MATYVNKSDCPTLSKAGAITWSCPVPFFGDIRSSSVATVGINPSNKEFVGPDGAELSGKQRRFPTLGSLNRKAWPDVDAGQIGEIVTSCITYFDRSPYHRWFQVLERILEPSGLSLYGIHGGACHLDLVPYATEQKWGSLSLGQQRTLLDLSTDAFGRLLCDSKLRTLVLNGQSVVREFERLTRLRLKRIKAPMWSLSRSTGDAVTGWAYLGVAEQVGSIDLDRQLSIVGYNHNLQSSFGVTKAAISSIANWLAGMVDTPEAAQVVSAPYDPVLGYRYDEMG